MKQCCAEQQTNEGNGQFGVISQCYKSLCTQTWHFYTLESITGTCLHGFLIRHVINKIISKISGYYWQHYILMKTVKESKPRHGMGLSVYVLYILNRNRESIHQSLYQFLKHTVSTEKQLKLMHIMLYFRLCGCTHAENIAVLQNR